ncbi:MAG TPA: pilus assembly protein N-terminal domain-containing protein [Rhizomicrobium sp.]|nr:pilus assembly protein N-terminal domain-containing protein [Rhizomicrobium sp.]
MRRTLTSALFLLSGLVPAFASDYTVSVPMDEVRTIAFPRTVATVYVGNPLITDVNMIDARHAFVLGKSFGATNIIALDSTGHQVSNTYVVVSGNRGATVILQKGSTHLTLSCAGPRCESAPRPGDVGYTTVLMPDVEKHVDDGAKSTGQTGQ